MTGGGIGLTLPWIERTTRVSANNIMIVSEQFCSYKAFQYNIASEALRNCLLAKYAKAVKINYFESQINIWLQIIMLLLQVKKRINIINSLCFPHSTHKTHTPLCILSILTMRLTILFNDWHSCCNLGLFQASVKLFSTNL